MTTDLPPVTDALVADVIAKADAAIAALIARMDPPTAKALALEVRRRGERIAELEATVRRLRDGIEIARDEMGHASHYAHHDPKGTAGANCPACQAMSRAREALRR